MLAQFAGVTAARGLSATREQARSTGKQGGQRAAGSGPKSRAVLGYVGPSQPAASDSTHHLFRVLLSGFQPVLLQLTPEQRGRERADVSLA